MLTTIPGPVVERTGGQESSCTSTTSNAGLKSDSVSIRAIGESDVDCYGISLRQITISGNSVDFAEVARTTSLIHQVLYATQVSTGAF